jgi:hypothetical protein
MENNYPPLAQTVQKWLAESQALSVGLDRAIEQRIFSGYSRFQIGGTDDENS